MKIVGDKCYCGGYCGCPKIFIHNSNLINTHIYGSQSERLKYIIIYYVTILIEAVRVREDFNDLAVIKGVSLGAIGKAVGVDPAMKNEIAFEDDARANEAYCDVLASLLDYYFYSFSELDGWCVRIIRLMHAYIHEYIHTVKPNPIISSVGALRYWVCQPVRSGRAVF